MGSSPMLYFAVATLDVQGGVQVTGSHNPADYNGFKMLLNGRSVFRSRDQGSWTPRRRGQLVPRRGQGRGERYRRRLCRCAGQRASTARPNRIGWDAGNGAAGPILEKLLRRLPGEHHPVCRGRRPLSQSSPRPHGRGQSGGFEEAGGGQGLDFGFAFDGDADRIGAVECNRTGDLGDQLLVILAAGARRMSRARRSLPMSRPARTLVDRSGNGRDAADVEDRHSLIKSKMKETHAPLASGMRGHIFFEHQWFGFDDALARGRDHRDRLRERQVPEGAKDEMPVSVATPELRFQVDEAASLPSSARSRAAGSRGRRSTRPTAQGQDGRGWWLPRASNTQEVPRPRRARGKEGLERLMATVNEQLDKSGIAAVLPIIERSA